MFIKIRYDLQFHMKKTLLFSRPTDGLDEQMYQIDHATSFFQQPTDGLDEQMYQIDNATSTVQQTY